MASVGSSATRLLCARKDTMLWIVAALFLLLWITGMIGAWAMGWLVHLFLVLAIAAAVLQLLRGRKASG